MKVDAVARWAVFISSVVVITVPLAFIANPVGSALRSTNAPAWLTGVVEEGLKVVAGLAAVGGSTLLLNALGIPLSLKHRSRRAPGPLGSPAILSHEVVEVTGPPRRSRIATCAWSILCVIALLGFAIVLPRSPQLAMKILPVFVMFAAITAFAIAVRFLKVLRLGPEGLSMPKRWNVFVFNEPVPWCEIAGYELVESRGLNGALHDSHLVVRTVTGDSRLDQSLINLFLCDEDTRELALCYLKRRFPKLDEFSDL